MLTIDNYTQEYKATKKQIVRLQLNEKKSKEGETKLMNWYWKRKQTWKKDLITYDTHPWIMFSFNWLVIIWRGRRFTWGLLTWRRFNFGRRWARELGSWKLDNFLGRHMCIIHWIKSLLDSKYLWNCKQWTEIFFLPMKEIWKQKVIVGYYNHQYKLLFKVVTSVPTKLNATSLLA